jgi:hypothetical protein
VFQGTFWVIQGTVLDNRQVTLGNKTEASASYTVLHRMILHSVPRQGVLYCGLSFIRCSVRGSYVLGCPSFGASLGGSFGTRCSVRGSFFAMALGLEVLYWAPLSGGPLLSASSGGPYSAPSQQHLPPETPSFVHFLPKHGSRLRR